MTPLPFPVDVVGTGVVVVDVVGSGVVVVDVVGSGVVVVDVVGSGVVVVCINKQVTPSRLYMKAGHC